MFTKWVVMQSNMKWIPFILVLFTVLAGCSKDDLASRICVPGTFECTETGARTCDLKGTSWYDTPCAEGEICVDGVDGEPDECREQLCEPGARVCGADHLYVYQCDDTGTSLCYSHSCSDPPMDGVCYDGDCVAVCDEGQKSYLGCEYFSVDLDNANVPCGTDEFGNIKYCDAANSQYAVVLSNPDVSQSAYVLISKGPMTVPNAPNECESPDLPDNYVDAAVIPPKGIKIFELPARNINGTEKDMKAYRIVSNIPVTSYQFNPLENEDVFSNDASLLLPTTTASQDFLVMTREQTFDDLKGFLTVVGINDEPTTVGVTVTSRTFPGPGIPALEPGEQFTTELNKYEILNIETNFIGGDLTGSRVQSDKPVLVFAGSEASNAPNTNRCDLETNTCAADSEIECGAPYCANHPNPSQCSPHEPCAISELITCCADHLEQQLFPVSTWGKSYIAIRSMPRGAEKDTWRVLASEDGTEVTFSPASVGSVRTLNSGEWFEIESNADFFINSTKPILVGQFLAAEQAPDPGRHDYDAGIGDPAFILAVPVKQFRDSYVFLAPDKYEEDYVSIAIQSEMDARLDGNSLADIPQEFVTELEGTSWKAIRMPITDGFHSLSCVNPHHCCNDNELDDGDVDCDTAGIVCGCSVMVHGYDSYVSYGYPGGLNLEDL